MATAIAIHFPLGRYHATPWERAVNEGEIEWPPSMWRLARALIATRHHRWPELEGGRLDAVLAALTKSPPAYWTPPVSRGHTRHYMPALDHQSGAPSTDLVLDPYAWVEGDDPLLVRWEVELTAQERADLARLCQLVPYLGRSESLAEIELLEEAPDLDEQWWQLDSEHRPSVQLLQPGATVTRAELEVTTPQLRRQRLPLPPQTSLRTYGRLEVDVSPEPPAVRTQVEAVRWRLETKAPFRVENGILATEHLRTLKLALVQRALPAVPAQLSGKQDAAHVTDDHRHAHWLWLGDGLGLVHDLVLWMPDGNLGSDAAAALISRSGFKGFERWNPTGFTEGSAHLVGLGPADQVLPELVGPATAWTARTPYVPVRHRKKNQSVLEWVEHDVGKECEYRGLPAPVQVELHRDRQAEAVRYRRYRWKESMAQRKDALWVSLRFADEVAGPLCLGRLSHFGLGLFAPGPGEPSL
ncbi:type I-U CRISPR-associated protein Csb2 [uncultured Friedmanniella sp.]|uniref:type I-G CRISPR-associated protein Csb2 n=1 Tax=uncultured Friedmanniella sp. TaxID=335381 RepID=UPI0035CBE029